MKNFDKLLLAALMGGLAFSAQAEEVTITVNVEHPEGVECKVNPYGGESYARTMEKGANTFALPEYSSIEFKSKTEVRDDGNVDWYLGNVTCTGSDASTDVYSGGYYLWVGPNYNGYIYTLDIVNLNEARTSICNVSVDDPEKVSVMFNGTQHDVKLQAGMQPIKYSPVYDKSLEIRSATTLPLWSVQLNNEPVTDNWGTFNVELTDGCNIDIISTIPDDLYLTVTFDYTSEQGVGVISKVGIVDPATEKDDEPVINFVEDFDGHSVKVKAGHKINIYGNDDYKLESMMLDGENTYWAGSSTWPYSYRVMKDATFVITAKPYEKYPVTIIVDNPENINFYIGYGKDRPIKFEGTGIQVEIPENVPTISWTPAVNCYVENLTLNGETPYNFSYATYVQVKAGDKIEATTGKFVVDKKAVVWLDDADALLWTRNFSTRTLHNTNRNYWNDFKTGYNVIDFGDEYNPFEIGWNGSDGVLDKLYVNDVLQASRTSMNDYYSINLSENDVIKIFLAEEPVQCEVTFDVEDGLGLMPTVMRDLIVEVDDLTKPAAVFAGTQMDVLKGESDIDVKVNDAAVEPDAEGNYSFLVNDPATTVAISKKSGSGIFSADVVSSVRQVYTLQGVKVDANLKNLPAGIYIVDGKKVFVK